MRRALKLVLPAGILTALLFIPAVQAGDRAGDAQTGNQGIKGRFNLQAMYHTSTAQFPVLPGVNPWDGRSEDGVFAYRSIPCTGNAPVNNISSNLPSYNTRVRGSRVPSSTRLQPLRFRVRRIRGVRMITGRINLTVCQLRPGPTPNPDPVADINKPKIKIAFRARFKRESAEDVRYHGTFRILGGTQRYEDLTGSGDIAGYLFCFAPKGCAGTGGKYLDGNVTMQGEYADPTPELAAG